MKDNRLSWDDYFMGLTDVIASRSTCLRRHVGAIAVDKNHRIIGTGYNGAPSGMQHCTEDTCIRIVKQIPSGQQLDICKAIHAEANIVLQLGHKLEHATLYCNTQPCSTCLKLLIGAGVDCIMWKNAYDDPYVKTLMKEYGSITTIDHEDSPLYRLDKYNYSESIVYTEYIPWDKHDQGPIIL